MFLHLLQTDEEKEEFIHMAFIVAIAHVEDSDVEDSDEEDVGSISPDGGIVLPIFNRIFRRGFFEDKNWKMSAVEKAIIDGFLREIKSPYNEWDDEVDISINYSRFSTIIDELAPVLSKLTRLSEEERRLEIIEKLIEDGIAWDTIEQIEPKSARSMMIELLSVALVDGDYAPLEKVVIESIAKKLSIDADEIEEMEAFVRNMNQVYQSGLEIITN